MTPVDKLVKYIRKRYETNESFENLVASLREEEKNTFLNSYQLDSTFWDSPILYAKIENTIIEWSNDNTKTAGELTRQILNLVK
jgi:hypothetical protein